MSLLIIFLICFVLSAFFSGSEMAFVTSDELKIRAKADQGDLAAQKIVRLKSQTQSFLTAILVGNNIVNITATTIFTYWLQTRFGIESEWLVTLVMAPLILIFGEIVPKDYSRIYGQQILLEWANLLSLFLGLLKLPVSLVLRVVHWIIRALGIGKDKSIFVSETEFRMLIEESAKSGILEHHERQLINMILDFERIHIDSVMIPMAKVSKVSITDKIGDVKKIAKETNAKVVLVYEEIPTIIVGLVYVFDLLFEENEALPLKDYLRSPTFLRKETSLEKAFLTLQQRRQSYAVVTDSHDEVKGVVPIEGLLAV